MCIQVTQTYNTCSCKTIRHLICQRHIDHTHKQVDNAPCPDFQERAVQTHEGGCRDTQRRRQRPCETKTSWTFENWTDWRYREDNWKFCEERRPGNHACEDGSWLLGNDHTCGLGWGEYGWWRHRNVNADGDQSDEDLGETQKELNAEGEQENPDGEQAMIKSEDDGNADVDMEAEMERLNLEDVKMESDEEASDPKGKRPVKVKLEDADTN